jgi:hypothetical protein
MKLFLQQVETLGGGDGDCNGWWWGDHGLWW